MQSINRSSKASVYMITVFGVYLISNNSKNKFESSAKHDNLDNV